MSINKYVFNPIITRNNIDNTRFINLLPVYHQNDTLKNFTSSSVEHLFTPGDDITLDGYIGEKPAWYNPNFDYYIPEINSKRKFYQLSASTVVYNQDRNLYDYVITYPDYIDSLNVSGSITTNQSRMFETEYYTWCPSIDIDKFLNYSFYLWVSDDNNPTDPDYITIDKNSRDKNPWSISNNWIHTDDFDATTKNITTTKAQRPIIEFFPNIELYNYGIFRRLDVNFVYSDSNAFANISGKTSVTIDGIEINKSYINSNGAVRVLILNDSTTTRNNKIYTVIFDGTLTISLDTDGINSDGTPSTGEIIKVLDGNSYSGIELHYDSENWILSQTKSAVNQSPLFQLYDMNGVSLSDSSKYPSSNFHGNKLFCYNESGTTTDNILGLKLTYDTYGQIQYRNYLTSDVYTYVSGTMTNNIDGYYFFNILDDDLENNLHNEWYLSPKLSSQKIVNEYTFDGINFIFNLSCVPDTPSDTTVQVISVNSDLSVTTTDLNYGIDFLIQDNQILMPNLNYKDTITVKSYSSSGILDDNGYYELPINLTANPDNDDISLVSYGDVYHQFVEVLTGQDGFSGNYNASNNYRKTSKSTVYGTNIIQSKNNLLLGMFLTSDENYDVISSIEYVKKEYRRFRNKFEAKITEYMTSRKYTSDDDVLVWVNSAITELAKGKSTSSPFFNNGFGSSTINYFIPETPSYLGLYEGVSPSFITDYNSTGNIDFIQGHDGSLIVRYNDYRDEVILALEKLLFNSINSRFTSGYIAADYNETKKSFTYSEWNDLLRPFFETWVSKNNLNYQENTTFNEYNPYTWNWSNVVSNIDGTLLPGSAKGIYLKYYNTFTPHSTPWVMLGLASKPSWWESNYGVAPYTSNNIILWTDIKNGYIRGEDSYSDFTYSWILEYIPVDAQGYLKDPKQIGIAKSYPNQNDRSKEWDFTDCGPIEILWRISSEFAYSVIEANYLAMPSKFITESWDSLSTITIMSGTDSEQLIDAKLNRRKHYSDYTTHNELIDNSYIRNIGFQQIISDYLASKSNSISDFANDIRNLSVRLVYKMGGFTDQNQITLTSDSSDIIPEENYDVILYNSPVISEYFYSGILIRKVQNGYQIYGYDNNKPYFNIYNMSTTSSAQTISVTNTTRHQIIYWEPYFYYPKGTVVEYSGSYYECITDHNSQIAFNSGDWKVIERPFVTSTNDAKWYSKIVNGSDIQKVVYGSIFNTVQDLITFLNGYQYYLESVGFEFNTIVDGETNILSDFRYSAENFMTWVNSDIKNDDFLIVSPMSSQINFSTEYGEIKDIEDTANGNYSIINKFGTSISPYDISFTRSNGGIRVTALSEGFCGFRIRIFETEHIIVLDNKTVFNDVLYNPIFNIRQPRLKISGFKTGNWYGRYDAPGFIITGNSITPNFERAASNFRKFYDTTYSFDNTLQERAWANIGFHENDDLTKLSLSRTNQLDLYRGAIQNKGTVYPFERLLNSKTISNNKDIKFYEEWAFRVGDYGGDNVNKMMSFQIKQSDIKNNPQLIEFNTLSFDDSDTFEVSFSLSGNGSELLTLPSNIILEKIVIKNDVVSNIDNMISVVNTNTQEVYIKEYKLLEEYYFVNFDNLTLTSDLTLEYNFDANNKNTNVDIKIYYKNVYTRDITSTTNVITLTDVLSSKTGEIISKDPLWDWRLFDGNVNWVKKSYDQIEDGFFPNAGYVKIDTVNFFCKNPTSLNTKYFDVLNDNNSTIITSDITFDFSDYTSAGIITKTIIAETSTGYYRVNKVNFDVTSPFNSSMIINVGRPDQLTSTSYSPNAISGVTYQDLQNVEELTYYPSILWNSSDFDDNSIQVQFYFNTSTLENSSIGVKSDVCYDKVINNVSSNFSGKVTITVELEILEDSFLPNQRLWLYEDENLDWMTYKLKYDGDIIDYIDTPSYDGQGSVVALKTVNDITIYNEDIPLVLSGVNNISPSITSNLYPKINNSRSLDVDYNTSNVELIKVDSDAGMNFTNLVINIIEPFVSETGETLSFNVGTNSNNLLAQSSTTSNPTPTVPSFSSTDPITVHIPNSKITVFNDAGVVYVDITRSGNIFGLPNTCSDLPTTSVGWQVYAIDQNNNFLDANGNVTTSKVILQNGTATFTTPADDSTTYVDYWDSKVAVTLDTTFEYMVIELLNPVSAVLGTDYSSVIDLIEDENNSTSTYLNPQVPGKTTVDVAYFNLNTTDDIISLSVENAVSGSAIITLEYTYLNGFELFDANNNPFVVTEVGDGGNIFRFIQTRYDNISDANTNLFTSGDIIEVDNNGNWEICEFKGTSFDVIYNKTSKIDSSLIKDGIVYNNSTNFEEVLEVYDPYKGILPSNIRKNIDYILDYDPARYNNDNSSTNNFWSETQVGRYWWDISQVRYLDYENFDDNYKIKYWGYILPETVITVYQWVKSPVPPSEWNDYITNDSYYDGYDENPSGSVPDDLSDFSWSEIITYDKQTDTEMTSYYFWVSNSNVTPKNTIKTLSPYGLQEALSNPLKDGLSYISVIDSNKLLVGGIKNYINDTASMIKIEWKENNSDMLYHKEWELVRYNDTNNLIPSKFWKKMKNCLTGYNFYDVINDYNFTITTANINQEFIEVEYNENLTLIDNFGIIKINNDWYQYTTIVGNKINLASKLTKDYVGNCFIQITTNSFENVPNQNLTSYEQNGTDIRPSQSWYPIENNLTSRYARKVFVRAFNEITSSFRALDEWYDWASVFTSGSPEPTEYTYKTDDPEYMNILLENKVLNLYDRILLEDASSADGFWVLYEYNPYSYYSNGNFVIVDAQRYRLQDGDFWESVDWYADGYSVENYPIYTFDSILDMTSNVANIDITLLNGTLIQVNTQDANDTRWSWYVYDGVNWNVVAKQKSTIKLLDTFWKNTTVYGVENINISDIKNRDGTNELGIIIDAIYSNFFTNIQISEVFFTMVKLAFSLNQNIDWVFKTSFLYLGGYREKLTQSPVDFVNHIDNIINYVDVMKPYHVTIRDYINAVSYGPDIANVTVTDFDFPSYTDTSLGSSNPYRVLNPIVQSPLNHNSKGDILDTNIVNSSEEWSYWYDNYLGDNNPIRKKNIVIKFDRIGNYTDDQIDNLPEGIRRDYEFKGTYVTSPNFTNGDWDEFPWDYYAGWENELNYFTGDADDSSTSNPNLDTSTGDNNKLTPDYSRRDFDIDDTNNINDENYLPESIEVDGNKFIQPEIDANHSSERVPVEILEPITIISTTIDDNNKVTQKYMITKDSIDTWEFIDMTQGYGSLIQDDITSIEFDTNGLTFHDPNNPTQKLLDEIKLVYVENGYTQDQIDKLISRTFPGVLYINNERILYWGLTKGTGNVITVTNLQRNVNGLISNKVSSKGDKIYDGSVLSWATMDNMKMNQNKNISPTISYTLTNNIWKLGNLNICYNK